MNVNDMQQFKCHKVVRAARIDGYDTTTLSLRVNKAIVEVEVGADWMQRHKPEPGGYFVVYADGYQSYSTPEAFEAGYHELPPLGSSCGGTDDARQLEINRRGDIAFKALISTGEIVGDADFSDALTWLKEGKRVQRAGWNGAGQYVILIPGDHLARSAGYGFGEAIGEFTFGNVLALKNAQNTMQPGWVPSMGDLMATDWQVVS